MTSKASLIDAIREINPTAGAEWLARFSEAELEQYLDHLRTMLVPNGIARWVRPAAQPAAFVRESA
ncbi:MAG: hypothetical protein ACKO0W_11715 [Planctomycetota bacterium]